VINPTGTVRPILDRLRAHDFVGIYSQPLLDELADVLTRPRIAEKYLIGPTELGAILSLLIQRGERVDPIRSIQACRDPKDNMVLEAAVAGAVDCIVSTDQDLIVLSPFEGIPVLSAGEFLALLDQPDREPGTD
jgi:uncharacterized protein